MKNPIEFTSWGRLSWHEAHERMLALRDQRLADKIPDQVFFLEHTPVVTMGRRPSWGDLKKSKEELEASGVECVETDRGGKLTAHEPGQLVIYFVVDIQKRLFSIERWVQIVEQVLKDLLEEFGIKASCEKENPGLWIGANKIASIGFHIHKGVTTHGVALNVSNDLALFDLFIPCGLSDRGVTSIQKETGQSPALTGVQKSFQRHLTSLLDRA